MLYLEQREPAICSLRYKLKYLKLLILKATPASLQLFLVDAYHMYSLVYTHTYHDGVLCAYVEDIVMQADPGCLGAGDVSCGCWWGT